MLLFKSQHHNTTESDWVVSPVAFRHPNWSRYGLSAFVEGNSVITIGGCAANGEYAHDSLQYDSRHRFWRDPIVLGIPPTIHSPTASTSTSTAPSSGTTTAAPSTSTPTSKSDGKSVHPVPVSPSHVRDYPTGTFHSIIEVPALTPAPTVTPTTATAATASTADSKSVSHSPSSLGRRILVFGGKGNGYSNKVYEYLLSAPSQSAVPSTTSAASTASSSTPNSPAPKPSTATTSTAAATTPTSVTADEDTREMSGGKWRVIDDVKGVAPSPRYGHSAVYIPEWEAMLVFGGYDSIGTACNDLHAFNVRTHTWTAITPIKGGPIPAARYLHCAFAVPVETTAVLHPQRQHRC